MSVRSQSLATVRIHETLCDGFRAPSPGTSMHRPGFLPGLSTSHASFHHFLSQFNACPTVHKPANRAPSPPQTNIGSPTRHEAAGASFCIRLCVCSKPSGFGSFPKLQRTRHVSPVAPHSGLRIIFETFLSESREEATHRSNTKAAQQRRAWTPHISHPQSHKSVRETFSENLQNEPGI